MNNDLGHSAITVAVGLGAIVLLMGGTLTYAVTKKHLSVVDTIWGLGFVVIAIASLIVSTGFDGPSAAPWLLLAMVAIWGTRLAVHIGMRNAGKPEDRRYVDLIARSGGEADLARIAVAKVFGPQGIVMWIVSLPIMIGVNNARIIPVLGVLGVVVWAVGFFFEAVGDWQLKRFKADPSNKGQVMDQGLWRYTRHPNYFGDACVWWGIWLVAASSWAGLGTVIGPIAMTYFLAGKTGKTLTEKSMSESKPGYADYVRRTSGFFPLPPR